MLKRSSSVIVHRREWHEADPGSAPGSVKSQTPILRHDPEQCEAVFPRDKRNLRLRGDHVSAKSKARFHCASGWPSHTTTGFGNRRRRLVTRNDFVDLVKVFRIVLAFRQIGRAHV